MEESAMKTQPAKIRDSYMELILQVPLRPLRTKADYQRASDMIDRLASRDEDSLDAGESHYLDVLSDLVDAYEDKQSKLDRDNSTPAQRLTALMTNAGLSVNDIAQILGVSRPLVSMVINGKRALSRMNVQTLANHFRLDPGYFM
jgi:HTH-type transcriptional regulator/antitoxin HigA